MPPLDPLPARGRPSPRFEELARTNEDSIDVALGAALIARDVYEDLDIASLLARFDELSSPISRLGLHDMSGEAQALELAHYLYERQGSRATRTTTTTRRTVSCPTCSIVVSGSPSRSRSFTARSRSASVCRPGVSASGSLLVRLERRAGDSDRSPVIVNPFFGGRVLDKKTLRCPLEAGGRREQTLRPEHLEPAAPRLVLARVLTNLKAVYLARGENSRALLALDRLVTLTPDAPFALRERGLLAARLGSIEVARTDLKRFLELTPDASDAKAIEARLAGLSNARHWLD